MDYFKINYDKLRHLPRINFKLILILLVISLFIIIMLAMHLTYQKKLTCYGIYEDGVLKIEIEETLSDIVKNNNLLKFHQERYAYQVRSFDDYEIINDKIYAKLSLTIDKEVFDNEAGEVTILLGKEKIIKYIIKLLK